ncbi:MAG TPA: DUF4148 domain-containing protein [Caldimonas sp.]|jgi:hypothetical protein|nr:DUF4148 domain-containing protein [Caldimonas sp.]HEX2541643.1 DUF4148 domain-containing protein [Caldimonas sp.]
MKRKHIITLATAAVALVGAASAQAQPAGERLFAPEFDTLGAPSAKSRADVVAELRQAAEHGLVAAGEAADVPFAEETFTSRTSRAQVRAEAVEAIRLGLVPHGEATPIPADGHA